MRTPGTAARSSLPWWRIVVSLAAALGLAVATAPRADAAVSVSYTVASGAVQQGGHEVFFSLSKSRGGSATYLYVNVRRVDENGTAGTGDDVTQYHQYSFQLPADALTFADDLSAASFSSGPLKTGDGSGRDYGKIEFVAKNLAPVIPVPSRCGPYKYRDATLAGTIKFNTFLPGVGKLVRSSLGGELDRYTYRSPCPNPDPVECAALSTMSGYTYATDGSSASVYASKSRTSRYFSVSFSDPTADVAPANVNHSLSGGFPSSSFRLATTLRTGKFDGGPVKYLDGAVSFLATAPTESHDNGDCPDYKSRAGNITGSLMVDFTAGPDYKYNGGTGTATRYFAS